VIECRYHLTRRAMIHSTQPVPKRGRRTRRPSVWLIPALFALALSPGPTQAARRDRLVIIVVSGAMVEDVTDPRLPNLQRLLRTGACAVMTTRTAGTPPGAEESDTKTEAACVTLGAGARAAASIEARRAYSAYEIVSGQRASAVYQRLSLKSASDAEIVHLAAYEIAAENAEPPYSVEPGLIGDSLRKARKLTACIGNSDTDAEVHREAAVVCMDSAGIVDMGDVSGRMTQRNPSAPYGVEADHTAILAAFDKVVARADLIVVDSGDMARADWYGSECSEDRANALRRWAMRRTDRLVGEIARRMDLRSSMLMVVSPCPSQYDLNEGRKLTPVIMAGAGVSPGLLTSGSTRRPGLTANTDVAPTVLEFFGIVSTAAAVGRPIHSLPAADTGSAIADLDRELTLQNSRLVLMRTLAVLMTIAVIAGTLFRSRRRVSVRLALFAPAVAPVMLLLPIFGSYSALWTGVLAAAATVLALAIAFKAKPEQALVWMCAALCLALTFDLARGGAWVAQSPFGYSPADGSRYYGLGNELMGSLIGAAAIAAFRFLSPGHELSRRERRLRGGICLACFGALAILVGAPNAGANAGGAIASLAAAAAAFHALTRGRMNTYRWAAVVIAPMAIVLAFMAVESALGRGGQSHLGRAFDLIAGGDISQFALILERKAAMNLKLLQVSLWSKLLLVTLGCLLYLRTGDRSAGPAPVSPYTIRVICVGALAAFLFNDSGVVAAATCLVYAWSAALIADPDASCLNSQR